MRYALLVALAFALAGCGGGDGGGASSPTPSPTAAADREATVVASKAPVLVQLTQQRPGALLDKITVRRDGTGIFDRPSGGVGRVLRDVRIDPTVVDRLERDLRALPEGPLPKPTTRPAVNGATYIVRYQGRTLVARQGAEPKPLREPARLLADLLVGDGVSEIVRERLGGAAGSTHATSVGKAKEIVFFQRQGAGGATLDTVSVRADGTITRQRRYGGAGARFSELKMKDDGQLAKLERALRTVPGGSSMTVGSPPPGGAQYLLRRHGHAIAGRAGGIAPAARPAVKLLNGYIDGVGVVRVKADEQTHPQ